MDSLQNHLLIAMPSLDDPLFGRSVTYICEHNEDGAMGIVINHPLSVDVASLLEQLEIEFDAGSDAAKRKVCAGGPVQNDRGFVLHTPKAGFTSSMQLNQDLMITTSKDILEQLTTDDAPEKFILALGYAGWSAGQLEQELKDNSWLTLPLDESMLYELPYEERWLAAWRSLGVDVASVSTRAGHA